MILSLRGEGFLKRPLHFYAIGQSSSAYSKFIRPRAQAESAAFERDIDICLHVPLLFDCGTPFAIALGIAERAVFSIKRFSERLYPHIREKIGKNSPALANRNPLGPIHIKLRVALVVASLDHRVPSVIGCARAVHSRVVSMLNHLSKCTIQQRLEEKELFLT